jgi:hypothetical protein
MLANGNDWRIDSREDDMRFGWIVGLSVLACAAAVLAQGPGGPPGPVEGPLPSHQGGIVWYGTLRSGIAEAKRTNRPILLISAAPHCHNVSGIW